jgi:hypothetical protein
MAARKPLDTPNSAVWIVEMLIDGIKVPRWGACAGVALIRDDARMELMRWRGRNPYDKFRIRQYARVK